MSYLRLDISIATAARCTYLCDDVTQYPTVTQISKTPNFTPPPSFLAHPINVLIRILPGGCVVIHSLGQSGSGRRDLPTSHPRYVWDWNDASVTVRPLRQPGAQKSGNRRTPQSNTFLRSEIRRSFSNALSVRDRGPGRQAGNFVGIRRDKRRLSCVPIKPPPWPSFLHSNVLGRAWLRWRPAVETTGILAWHTQATNK